MASCVNKSLEAYKQLAAVYGDNIAESLSIRNNYEIPTIDQAALLLKGSKVAQFNKTVEYLQNTKSNSIDDLADNMFRIIHKIGSDYYVVKGARFNETPTPGAELQIHQANLKFLDSVNQELGPLFIVQAAQAGKRLFNAANPETAIIAEQYKKDNNINTPAGELITSLDKENSKRIADAFENLVHLPQNVHVQAAYNAMVDETLAQYNAITKAGYAVEIYEGAGEPYKNSEEMIKDVRENKHQYILSTEKDFGQNPISDKQREENPLLKDSGLKDVNGKTLLNNDIFRAVHDFFGHTERGNAFGPVGEENAWDVHARMYSPLARRAMTTETRGQNSWVNFGPHMRNAKGKLLEKGDKGHLSITERPFAAQKIGLLPEEFSNLRKTNVEGEYGNDIFKKNLDKLREESKNHDYPNVVEFAQRTIPAEYLEKYKSLYELAAQLELSVNVNDATVPYGVLASFGNNAINISPRNSIVLMNSWDEFVETYNHEVIHGIMSRNWGNEYKIQSKLAPVFKSVQDNFDSASDEVKGIIAYIADTTNEYGKVTNYETDEKTPQLEELITFAYSNTEFAKFLDSLPSVDNTEASDQPTLWKQLKAIVKGFFDSFTPKSLLDDVTNILDEAFTIEGSLKNYGERRQKYGWNRTMTIGGKRASNEKVTINQEILNQISKKNMEDVDKQPLVYNPAKINEESRKENEEYFNTRIRTNYAINNVVHNLSTRFNVPFEFITDRNSYYSGVITNNGTIKLNTAYLDPTSPFHEIIHGFNAVLRTDRADIYNNLIKELLVDEQGKRILERVKEKYPELNEARQQEEALAQYIGELSYQKSLESKPVFKQFLDWLKGMLNKMGVWTTDFKTNMSLDDFSKLILDPSFTYDLKSAIAKTDLEQSYQKVELSDTIKFNSLLKDTLSKLERDVAIPGRTESEKRRKYFSKAQVEQIKANPQDIEALDNYFLSALTNLKDINDRFAKMKEIYDGKTAKSKDDIKQLALVLKEIEDSVTLYKNASPLLSSAMKVFPDDESAFGNLKANFRRQEDLMQEYRYYGSKLVADWLFPYTQKAINQAKATGSLDKIIPSDIYNTTKEELAKQGNTNADIVVEAAMKEYLRQLVFEARQDATGVTTYLGAISTSRDPVSAAIGLALGGEATKAVKKGVHVKEKLSKLIKQVRGSVIYTTNEQEKEFHKKYMRQAKSWEYQGLDENLKETHKYVDRWAFHEEYKWDEFYNAKREFFDKLGQRPSKNDVKAAEAWNKARDAWFADNAIATKDASGKISYVPTSKYKNDQFPALLQDPYFKELYNTYKEANIKLGGVALRYGIIPQDKAKGVDVKAKIKEIPGKIVKSLREGIGEQEQVYYSQNIDGSERFVVPAGYTTLLDESELSFNLVNSVGNFATSAYKYDTMKELEPHVQLLKNFINGNAALSIDPRKAFKKTSGGISVLSKGEREAIPVEATKLNKQLNGFIDEAVYGKAMKKEVIKLWDAKFQVWKKGDVSNNGKPKVENIDGFENVAQYVGAPNLDYTGFEFGKERELGNYVVKMVQKDWNFSVKKGANKLGLLSAFQTMALSPMNSAVNLLRGKLENYIEATGGRYFNVREAAFADGEYAKSLINGSFLEDLRGGKPSFLSEMIQHYNAIQGEMFDEAGRRIHPDLLSKVFRKRNLFFLQNGGEHAIQTQLMISMMEHQKVTLKNGTKMSLYKARLAEHEGKLKFSDVNWSTADDEAFEKTLQDVNETLHGNYNKLDKAYAQRLWWTSLLMMYRKHIYNGFAVRYRKGYVNYKNGNYTEGYYRTFFNGVADELKEWIQEGKIKQFNFNEQEKYAARKLAADIAVFTLLLVGFKLFDDDDEENEFTDDVALVSRRLMSEAIQYTPVMGTFELAQMAKNPSATTNSVEKYWEAISQTISDPTAKYERNGPGYTKGDLKWKTKWGRALPVYRQIVNAQEPERLLQYYRKNSFWFFKPSSKKAEEKEKK